MELVNQLRNVLQRVHARFRLPHTSSASQTEFIDLAPTHNADEGGAYAAALLFATSNPRVSNIALTGPYGSGKSSIIKSFLKKHKRDALQISLAAFLPEATMPGGAVSKQEIERSILQQMLYGADANNLPLSRFKRIQTPRKSAWIISIFIFLGVASCWRLVQKSADIFTGKYFLPHDWSNWLNLTCFALGIIFACTLIHHFYVASFGVTLKSISLKDIEIAPVQTSNDSILNRHLDEIIYFFQSTKYDLVIIEDLDRFNNTDVFVTLREINSLINANAGVKRTIRFLYALRDDMFVNVDRTKFFEFIIPVIPIINSSNSIDKVIEHGKRLALDDRLDRQFLREVSRYLNDLRLIQNIFNEYAIYVSNLEGGNEKILNPNKLLAVLIYKNVFPHDFEELHRGKGNLALILGRHNEFITQSEADYKSQIDVIEERIDVAQRETAINSQELRRIYAMALIERLPAYTTHVFIDGQPQVEIQSLATSDFFERMIDSRRISYRTNNGYHNSADIAGLQGDISPTKTYKQRLEAIEAKSADAMQIATKSIRDLRSRIANLRFAAFNEVLRQHHEILESDFSKFGENFELAKYLVFEGYLDDTYYQYTSLFHSGRLSPSDNRYLIQIRGFVNPEPDFQIDNPREVIAAMRDGDFSQNYVLNVDIVNCILGDQSEFARQKIALFNFISANFERCEEFFKAYYATGYAPSVLTVGLATSWQGFIPAALASPERLSHITRIIAHLPMSSLEKLVQTHPALSGFVSTNLPLILGAGIDFEPRKLKALQIEVEDLSSIKDFPGIARLLADEQLYELTENNIEFIFSAVLGLGNISTLRTAHYTTVLGAKNSALISRVERNFGEYLKGILLRLNGNTRESVSTILTVIAHDELDTDDLRAFLAMQTLAIPSFSDIPMRLQATAFQLAKIEPSWENCLAFISSETFDADSLTSFLGSEAALSALSVQAIPSSDEATNLWRFLIRNDSLSDADYRLYVRGLPRPFRNFPEAIGPEKLKILVEERKIIFSPESLTRLDEHDELALLFVEKNIEKYLSDEGVFARSDDFRERLLACNISDSQRLSVIQSMDMAELRNIPSRARVLGPILNRTDADISSLDAASARALIEHSTPIAVQVSLFNKCQALLSDHEVREVIAALPPPFSEITVGYHTPYIPKSEENFELVKWMASRKLISSWSEARFLNEIRINLKRSDNGF